MEHFPSSKETSEETKIKTAIEWSPGEHGEHSFVRIVADNLSNNLKEFLTEHEYRLIFFEDLSDPEEMDRLERLFVEGQAYRDGKKDHKVAVIISRKAKSQIETNKGSMKNWRMSTQYILSFEI